MEPVSASHWTALMMLKKVITGVQAGVDRAALHAAVGVGLPVDGYCTKGGATENGLPTGNYSFRELATTQHRIRIENNVVVSDGTLIINKGLITDGTKLSYDYSMKHLVPCLIVQLDADQVIPISNAVRWIRGHQIKTLNIAGPRESKFPGGIYREAFDYLEKLFTTLRDV